jgi:hypothetical protein
MTETVPVARQRLIEQMFAVTDEHKNSGTVGSCVFYAVHAEAI